MIPLAGIAGKLLIESAALKAANNYLLGTPKKIISTIPLRRVGTTLKKPTKQAKKESLSTMGEGIVAGLAAVAGLVGVSSDSMFDSATTQSAENKALTDAKKLEHETAPLLYNQIALQNSMNGITDAINGNTIVTATVLGTLDANLSAISSTLLAISSTLLEISDNYSGQLESEGDLPYVDSETFYDLLEKSGANFHELQTWKSDEGLLVDRLSKSGSSYSAIKQAVLEFRKSNIPASTLLKANKKLAGITAPSPVSSSGEANNPINNPMNEWAKSGKTLYDFKMKEQTFNDLDGNPVTTMSPAQAQAVANATNARHKTDTNSEEFDESDFPSMLSLPVLPFIGSSDIYNPAYTTPTTNPFTHKNL